MKFRVYDNTEQRYRKGYTIDEDGELIKLRHGAVSLKRYTVEQFTGFTDKNGREIYEGDMFKYGNDFIVVKKFKDRNGSGLGAYHQLYEHFMNMEAIAKNYEVTGTVHDVLSA